MTDPRPGIRLQAAIELTAERTEGRALRGVRHDDADDTVGTIGTDDAVGFDPLPVLAALSAEGAPAVVIGQVAGILHGSSEPTGDLDLLWSGSERDAPAMTRAFGMLDADLTDDDGRPVDLQDAFVLPKVLFRTPSAVGDCCTPRLPWQGLDIEAFLRRVVTAQIGGVVVRYLGITDLIEMRVVAARPKDLRRAAELQRIAASRS